MIFGEDGMAETTGKCVSKTGFVLYHTRHSGYDGVRLSGCGLRRCNAAAEPAIIGKWGLLCT